MVKEPNPVHNDDRPLCDFLDRLREIFAAMDREYKRAAEQYQFQCDGCTDNCCLTRFYHHTYVEYHYLRRGFKELDPRKKCEVLAKAEDVCRATADADAKRLPMRLMCPLNTDSLCDLYPYRPMICRLHGIPHELRKPGQHVIHGPGCGTFDRRCADNRYYRFDRTPYYKEMAGLENEFKQALRLKSRIKMTVAEMIVSIAQMKKE
jgi:Fe-S-cluster containining protein